MSSDRNVRLTRRIDARPETVFCLIADPAGMSAWLEGEAEFQPEAGSPFTLRFPQYQMVIAGSVVEVDPPRKMVLTWGVAEGQNSEWFAPGASTLSMELEPDGNGTLIHLVHSDLPIEAVMEEHEGGWRYHITRLQVRANRMDLAERLPETWDTWYQAWAEPEPTRRKELLEKCCASDFTYADDYTTLEGLDMLSLHIANCLKFMPGMTVTQAGPAVVCRGQVLVPWRSAGAEGMPTFAGQMYARVALDGRLQEATSFWGPLESA